MNRLKRGFKPLLCGLILPLVSACMPVQLVSHYDEVIDTQAQQLQKKLDSYFISLQTASGDELKYKTQQQFYEDVLADLNAIKVRASGVYKSRLTIEQIDLARENFAYLVLLHKQCVTAPLTDDQKNKIKNIGVDLSMDCRVATGASIDASDRGEVRINYFVIAPIQNLFNQHLGAIMALELAKKRGESQSNEGVK